MKKKHKLLTVFMVSVLTALCFSTLGAQKIHAAPVTFTVNSTNDGHDASSGDGLCQTSLGECTFRAALEQANTNNNPSDQDLINFAIAGTGVHTITLTNSVDYSITQSVKINGYSQLGSSANTTQWPNPFDAEPTIEIDGSQGVTIASLGINSTSNVVVQGLVFANSAGEAIRITQSQDVSLFGNYIGVDPSGLVASYNQRGILSDFSSDIHIGGSDPTERNIIAASFGQIVSYNASDNMRVQGNYFGVGADGVTAFPSDTMMNTESNSFIGNNILIGGIGSGEGNSFENSLAVSVSFLDVTNGSILGNRISGNHRGIAIAGGDNNIIGNGTAAGRNVISGNDSTGAFGGTSYDSGVIINSGEGSLSIKGNYIGVAEDGVTAFGNGLHGIAIGDASDLVIGGVTADEQNIIANNGANGIDINGYDPAAKVAILGNSIYNNTDLGIDLVADGDTSGIPTPNDTLDADAGPNGLLNAPALKVPVINGSDTEVGYRLDVPAGDYRVEFFSNTSADPSGYGEGETLIGTQNVTSLGSGRQLFSATLSGTGHTNIRATVTAIDVSTSSGFGATSEFSGAPSQDNNLEVTKSVVNQNSIINGTIAYTVEVANNGEDDLDLTQFTADPGDPLNTALFNDIFPSNLSFSSVSGDADCSEQNSAASFGTLFADRTSSMVISCAYSGSDTSLASGDSLTFTLNFTVSNPFNNVFTNYVLNVPSVFDADHVAYEDAVSSGDDIITELDDTIDNLGQAATVKPVTDVGITKTLTNPEDVAQGADLTYDFTYTNHGPDSLNLTEFGTPFMTSPLVIDYLHPDLTPVDDQLGAGPLPNSYYVDAGNANLTCLWGGPGSSVYFSETVHTDYGVVVCWYTGTSAALSNGGTIDFSLDFHVANNSNLAFTNYALADFPIQASSDPDIALYSSLFNGYPGDIVSQMRDSAAGFVDNLAATPLPVDTSLSMQLADPEDFQPGGTVYYDATITNRGPAAEVLAERVLLPNGILSGLYPGSSLTLVGATNPGITCNSFGPGSNLYWGAIAQDHTDHQLFNCMSADSDVVIAPNSSYVIHLQFTVSQSPANQINVYSASSASTDPDLPAFNTALGTATEDVIDTFENDNFARTTFAYASDNNDNGDTTHSGGGSSSTSSSASNSSGDLSGTGEDMKQFIVLAVVLLVVAGTVITVVVRKKRR